LQLCPVGQFETQNYQLKNKITMEHENLNTQESAKLGIGAVNGSPIELEPVLAEIEHINDLGRSTWYEVVYFDGKWRCYAGSKTFKDGERVIKWKYAKDCL
jgi:hypothetical protein